MTQEILINSRPDREITKTVIKHGNYNSVPYEDSRCSLSISDVRAVNLAGDCPLPTESRVFNSTFDGNLLIGDSDCYLDRDLELVVQTMCEGEICSAKLSYKDNESKLALEITCRIELKEITEEQLISDWSWERLYSQAVHHKERGVELVKEKKIVEAFTRFSRALKYLVAVEPVDPEVVPEESGKEMFALKLKLYNNLAHCQLQFNEYDSALELCNRALKHEADNVKALYRRCLAYTGLNLFEEAWNDIQQVLKLDPNDKLAQQKANLLKPKIEKINQNYSVVIKKMFEK